MCYDYKTLPVSEEEMGAACEGLTEKLNRLGDTGWELVSVITQNGLGRSPYTVFGLTQKRFLVLKRIREQNSSSV